METKSLLYGIIGFMLGGLLVSIAATTFEKPVAETDEMTMSQMTEDLKNKSGDAYDEAFITNMVEHHQAAVDMAKLSESRAKHDEIKTLSKDIIKAQQQEIMEMKHWQALWGYDISESDMGH